MTRPVCKKRSNAQKAQLALVHTKCLGAETPTLVEEDTTSDADTMSLKSSLISTQEELLATKLALGSTNNILVETQNQLQVAETKTKILYGDLRVQRRKFQRTAAKKKGLQDHIKLLESVELRPTKRDPARAICLLDTSCAENATLKNKLSVLLDRCAHEAAQAKDLEVELRAELHEARKQNFTLQKQCDRAPEIKAKAIECSKIKADKENHTFRLLEKGIYKPKVRELARTLVAAGCSQEYVGGLVQTICENAGLTVSNKMSRRTVSRALLEGGVAAKVQLGHELAQTKGNSYT